MVREGPPQTSIDFIGVVRVRDVSSCVIVGPGNDGIPQCDGAIPALWDVELVETIWGEAPAEFLLAGGGAFEPHSKDFVAGYLEYTEGRDRRLLIYARIAAAPVVRYQGLSSAPRLCGREVTGPVSSLVWGKFLFHPDGSGRVGQVDPGGWKEGHQMYGLTGDGWIAEVDASDRWMDGNRLKELIAERYVEMLPRADPLTPEWYKMDEIVADRSWYIQTFGGLCVPDRETGAPTLCGATRDNCGTEPAVQP